MTTKKLSFDPEADMYDIPGESEDITDQQNIVDNQLNDIFSEFGGHPDEVRIKISVLRIIPNRADFETCFQCTPNELPITDRIIEEYGPGRYEIRVYMNGKVKRILKFNVAERLKKPLSYSKPQEGGDLKDLLGAMMENQRQMFEQMQSIMKPPQVAPVDPMQSMFQQLQMMKMMKEIMGDSSPANQMGLHDVVSLAKEFAELGGGGTEKGSADVLYKMVETAFPLLIEGAKNSPQNKAPHFPGMAGAPSVPMNFPLQPGAMRPPAMPGAPTIGPQPKQGENPAMFLRAVVARKLPELIDKAKNNKSPELYAEVVLDSVPDAFFQQYCGFVAKENALDMLIEINPEVAVYKEWFEKFREETVAFMREADQEEGGSPLTSGNLVDHASGNSSANVAEDEFTNPDDIDA